MKIELINLEKVKGFGVAADSANLLAEKLNEIISYVNSKENHPQQVCPPHNFIPYSFVGAWGSTMPPPNMKCTKCLLTTNF